MRILAAGSRTLVALLAILSVSTPVHAQCPDGSPPPCGAAAITAPAPPAFDADVVAVAPFDVLVPGLDLWREGLVDVLSRRLDGAGPLRTVSASAVINGWTGRADPVSARRLGRRTRAEFAVFGELVGAGMDSVRISVSVLDVTAGKVTGTLEARNAVARMDLLADTVTLRLLRVLGEARGGGVLSVTDFDTRSLPALKAYLEGEQLFRRAMHDSAAAHFTHAITLDSGFTQAHRRLSWTKQWQCSGEAPDFSFLDAAMLRYAQARGLSVRDSMALQIDSMFAAFARGGGYVDIYAELVDLTLGATERAVRAFPRDAEFLHLRGEVLAGSGKREAALEAFERAIVADPGLAPPYMDAGEMAAPAGDYARARRLLQAYLRINGSGDCASAARLFADLLPGGLTGGARARRIQQAPAGQLWKVVRIFETILDPGETAIGLLRTAHRQRISPGPARDTALAILMPLTRNLRLRGHLAAADSLDGGRTQSTLNRLFIGAVIPAALPRVNAWGVADGPIDGWHPYGLWLVEMLAQAGDTATLDSLARRADSLVASAAPPGTPESEEALFQRERDGAGFAYAVELTRAVRLLAVRDTSAAIAALAAVSDTACYGCSQHVPLLARLHAARGEFEAAARYYRTDLRYNRDARHVLWAFERAQALERVSDRDGARTNYRFVVDAWPRPDGVLSGVVEQSRQALRRLN